MNRYVVVDIVFEEVEGRLVPVALDEEGNVLDVPMPKDLVDIF